MSRTQPSVEQVISSAAPKRAAHLSEAAVPAERVNYPLKEIVGEVRRASRHTDIPQDALVWWPC